MGPDEGTQVVPSEDAVVGIGHETDCSGKGTNAEHRSDDGFTEVRNGVTIARKTLSALAGIAGGERRPTRSVKAEDGCLEQWAGRAAFGHTELRNGQAQRGRPHRSQPQ